MSLPEYQRYQELEGLNRSLEGPEAKTEFINKNLESSGLLNRKASQESLLSSREGLLDKNRGLLDPFKNITPNSSEARLKTAMNARPGEQVELVRQLDDLSKLSDTDFNKALKDLRTKRAFSGQDTNGSRKVNLFTVLGSAAGGFIGNTVGLAGYGAGGGAAVGASVGALADKYGPAITKKILDGVIKMGKSPTLEKIKKLDIPPAARAQLAKDFAEYNASPGEEE